jgi:hypothetical protein
MTAGGHLYDRVRAAVARDFTARFVDPVTDDLMAALRGEREPNTFERAWLIKRGFVAWPQDPA